MNILDNLFIPFDLNEKSIKYGCMIYAEENSFEFKKITIIGNRFENYVEY